MTRATGMTRIGFRRFEGGVPGAIDPKLPLGLA